MSDKRTEIQELGEFGLIEQISKKIALKNDSSVKGIGDDAAVLKNDPKMLRLLSSDMLIEGVHFDLSYMPLQHLGYKSVVANVSDIAAMNGKASQLTINLGLSNRFSVEAVELFYEGVRIACEAYGVDTVGGDTTTSPSGLTISVAITGEVSEDRVVYRSGAGEKEIICATGDLGAAFMGLEILEREKQVFLANPDMQPELEGYDYIVKRQLRPEARTDIIEDLAKRGVVPTSMIDISDGLASDLMHICSQSKVGAMIYESAVPVDQMTYNTAVEFKIDPVTAVLNGGEDYELLFTISQSDHEKLQDHPDIHFIGHTDDSGSGINLFTKGENLVPIKAQGWDHFRED